MRQEVWVGGEDVLDAAVKELPLALDRALAFDEYPTSSGAVGRVVGLLDEVALEGAKGGEGEGDAGLGHADRGPQGLAEVQDAVRAELVGGGIVLANAAREVRDGEHRVVRVLRVVCVQAGAGGGREAAAVLERCVVAVRVRAEDGAE